MKDRILTFFNDLDNHLLPFTDGEPLKLYHIGRSSLVWKYGFTSATNDVDFLKPKGSDRLIQIALEKFGRGSTKAEEYGFYFELVDTGLPPVPPGYDKRAIEVEEKWKAIRVFHLEPNDLAVTKLKRFATKDREDIRQMCDMDLIDAAKLEARTGAARPHHH